ncbi:MAG TPA: hypothetical protein VFZ98_00730, partial [Vicinamibacterales bacterium]
MQGLRRYLFALDLFALGACLVSASCGGGGGSSPTAPAAPPSNAWSVAGRVFTLDTGNGVAGATVTPNWALKAVTADGSGNYKLSDTGTPASTPLPVTISGDSLVSHDILVNWVRGDRTGVDISMIHDVPPFSMDFYHQLVRGTYDHTASDGAPFPVLRWMSAPSFYVRTVDQNGNAIEPAVIAFIVDAIPRAVSAWSAGQ